MDLKEGLWKVPVGAVAPFLVVIALAILFKDAGYHIPILYYGILVGSMCGSATMLLCRFNLSVEDGSPREVLSQLAHSLRVSSFIVKEEKRSIVIQITSTAAVKIRATAVNGATLVTYQPDATPGGWAVYVILFISGYGAVFGIPIAAYLFLKARKAARERVLPRLPSTGARPKRADELGISEILADSLSEGRRMAKEAYEATKSNYEDEVILSLIGSMAIFIATMLGFLFADPQEFDIGAAFPEVALSLVLAASFGFLTIHYLRKTRLPRIKELMVWEEKLGRRLELETSAREHEGVEPSTLELLLEASLELPNWQKARVRGGLYLYPGTWLLIVTCAFLIYGGVTAILSASGNSSLTLIGATMLVVGIVGGALLHRSWKREVQEDKEMFSKAWDGRMRTLKSDMERIIGGM